MSYDHLAITSVILMLAWYTLFKIYWFKIKPYTIISRLELMQLYNEIHYLETSIEQLRAQNTMVWDGKIIKENTGQQKVLFEVPTAKKTDTINLPYDIRMGGKLQHWLQIWRRDDYEAFKNNMILVERKGYELWIEPEDKLRSDRVIHKLPFTWKLVSESALDSGENK